MFIVSPWVCVQLFQVVCVKFKQFLPVALRDAAYYVEGHVFFTRYQYLE